MTRTTGQQGRVGPGAKYLRVRLLGGFELRTGAGRPLLSEGTQRLLARVALLGPAGRSELSGCLWPDSSEQRALGRLRTQLWRVNQAVPDVFECTNGVVALRADAEVDVHDLLRRGRQVLNGALVSDVELRALCERGELLPGWGDDWLLTDRERVRQVWLHVCEFAAARFCSQGRHGLALETALIALGADQMRESAHRSVIKVHLEEGNHSEALRMYDECARLLVRELGVSPTFTLDSLRDDHRAAASARPVVEPSVSAR
jgi:DNA-binding SARP family transcriptional activator